MQIDYCFLPRGGQEVEDESKLITILVMVDVQSGWPYCMQLPDKSSATAQSKYVLHNIDLYLRNLGHQKVVLQHDAENAIRGLAQAIQNHLGASRVSVREAPPYSHQSQGAVESMNAFVQSQIRALWLDNRERYPELDITSNVVPWLIRHAGWLIARFHTRSRDKLTPYKLVTGGDYSHPVARFGEVVLGKIPKPQTKIQRRWVRGVWLGKLDRDDSHILGTSSGAIAVRSVRRLPPESQTDSKMLEEIKGLPWQPRDGVRHRVTPEVSHAMPMPLPAATAADSSAEGDEIPVEDKEEGESHPTLAVDGAKLDMDELTVHAAAQLEEQLGPSDDEAELPAGTAAKPSTAPTPAAPSPPPFRGAGWSSPMQALPDEPMSPSGLGLGGKREAPPQAEGVKFQRIGHLADREIWQAIELWGNSKEQNNPTALQRVSNVTDYVDQLLDPQEVAEARKAQLRKLWERAAFFPVRKDQIPRGAQVFHHKWVDKCSKGTYKSRFTCADVKARYSAEQEADLDVFVPTPTPESHSLLEVYALQNKWCTRSLDIVAAFLIGRDRGASEGKPVYVRAPVEWHDLFEEWLSTLPAGEKAKYKDCFKEMCFRLDGNLYGRRTAGSVYRNELQRGVKDPCVFRCLKTGVILVHHVDDIRAAGPADVLADLFEKEFPKYCEVQAGELEKEGTAVEFLGRTKIRTKDAIVTVPDAKHRKAIIAAAGLTAKDRSEVPSKQLDLMRVAPLDDEKTKRFRGAVGSAIYLSADRRDIQYATKELARRMSAPRECDWTAVVTLASYLQSHPHVIRVISTDKQDDGPWEIESYTDSDWAGCLETRRSTDSHVILEQGAVIQVTTQTQPGLPATSSPDTELRGVSRTARETIFVRELLESDFGISCSKPRLWTDSSSAMQASKRIGPGTKLRHLEVCEFYVQGAIQAKLLSLAKVKGTVNCANFLTKHPKSGTEVRVALPSLGM